MANAFNHMEAARSFKESVRLDSTCAMAYWGIAYVLGPNYNTSGNLGEQQEIRAAVAKAVQYSENVSDWEKELIGAVAVKFADIAAVNTEGYAEAMRKAYSKYADNDIIATLFAESIMNLHAWDLYEKKGGNPRPWTPEIVSVLENAMAINPDNPLANHLYIHAVEAAPDVEKGLPSANRLKTLVPAAGHLVHMPSHIYINTGDYYEGSVANEEAVKRDSTYIAECKVSGVYPQMYYPHNYHFLAATAALEGRGARAIEAAFRTSEIIGRSYLKQPGFATTQHYITIPYNVLVKFAQWEKILALPAPDSSLHYPKAIWHYARGMAYAHTENINRAKTELDSVVTLAGNDDVKAVFIWEINRMSDIAAIAVLTLKAEIARKEGDLQKAVQYLKEAVVLEDALNYNEPPDWFFSVRHALGDAYLQLDENVLAEQVYQEDLEIFPKNGFALNGLYHSLNRQGKEDEAATVKAAFEKAWKRADSKLEYSTISEKERKNLVIRIVESTPEDLMFIAGSFCNTKN
jgi:tetratricopeptide (TPR) repeat protein